MSRFDYLLLVFHLAILFYFALFFLVCLSHLEQTSPHVINAVLEAVGGMRVSLGSHKVLQYTLQGLFHPARKVREVYWKIYNSLYIGSQVCAGCSQCFVLSNRFT